MAECCWLGGFNFRSEKEAESGKPLNKKLSGYFGFSTLLKQCCSKDVEVGEVAVVGVASELDKMGESASRSLSFISKATSPKSDKNGFSLATKRSMGHFTFPMVL